MIKTAPRMLRKDDAGLYVGGPKLLQEMQQAGWIKPALARHRMVICDIKKLDVCCDRLSRGEAPNVPPVADE